MKQHNQIGKYTKKEEVLLAKSGKTFVTPNNKSWVFSYVKQGNKYIFCIEYKGYKMHIPESDFNKTNIDDLLCTMEQGMAIN
jgi:hypothetical protein